MEVCTLILQMFVTTQACVAQERCAVYPEANVTICVPPGPTFCPAPEAQYECKSPDGAVRVRRRSDLNLPKG